MPAFSREGAAGVAQAGRRYVQHIMAEDGVSRRIWALISQQNAHIYVCGGTKMGSQVRATVEQVVSRCGQMSADDAVAYVRAMQEGRPQRYVQELWS